MLLAVFDVNAVEDLRCMRLPTTCRKVVAFFIYYDELCSF